MFIGKESRERACLLIGAGDFTQKTVDLRSGDLCIAVDGGYEHCIRHGIRPDRIVGDFDSVKEEAKERIDRIRREEPARVLALHPVKDDTDMMAALQEGLAQGYRRFILYGATGGRIEHTVSNIQCLCFLKSRGADGCIVDGEVQITVLENESICLEPWRRGYFSLFALDEQAQGVTIKGMKYRLDQATVTSDRPIGVSNEFIGEEAAVTVEKGRLLLICSPVQSF